MGDEDTADERRAALAPYRIDDALLDRARRRRDRAALPAGPPGRGDHRGGPVRLAPARSGTRRRTAATPRRRCWSSCSAERGRSLERYAWRMPQPKKQGTATKRAASTTKRASSASAPRPPSARRRPSARPPASAQHRSRRATTRQRGSTSCATRCEGRHAHRATGSRRRRRRRRARADDARRRGRTSCSDLITRGRKQTEDLIGDARARSAAARRPAGDRVLRDGRHARAAPPASATFPILGYDDLTAAQVTERLERPDAGASCARCATTSGATRTASRCCTAIERKLG